MEKSNSYPTIKFKTKTLDHSEMIKRSAEFYSDLKTRRSVRNFSDKSFPKVVIENIIKTAGSAPSGANKQPWTFCVVTNAELKNKIRIAAEAEEKQSYSNRMSKEWLNDLAPLATDWQKPFIEVAPYIIVVFRKAYDIIDNKKSLTYYSQESVGIACGFLLAAIHRAGLAALTHTPSPMNFLNTILNRPENEKPFLLIPVGFPAEDCMVPDISRKTLDEIAVWY